MDPVIPTVFDLVGASTATVVPGVWPPNLALYNSPAKNGTAASTTEDPTTKIKFSHVGGHEGVGRIIVLGPEVKDPIKTGLLVGIRFLSRVATNATTVLPDMSKYRAKSTNHLHHEDGSFSNIACWVRTTLQNCLTMWIPASKGPCFAPE
jgi:hypothetical protein